MKKHSLKWYQHGQIRTALSVVQDNEDHFKYTILPPRGACVWWQLDMDIELGQPSRHDSLEQAQAAAQAIEDGWVKHFAKKGGRRS